MERKREEGEQSELKCYDVSKNNVVMMNADKRLEAMMKRASKPASNKRLFIIDAETYTIISLIGNDERGLPDEIFLNATPEALIKNQIAAEYCRKAIQLTHQKGEPISIKLPITLGDQTFDEKIHFKRGTRSNDRNIVIAYAD